MFRKVLVANRGEIAVRVQQTLQAMGIRAVAVYSDPDRTAPHVTMASEALPLEGAASSETYLCVEKIIGAAHRSGAEAVHPGYGFLAESPAFARACEDAGLVFIGPPPSVMELMGDKARAKETAAAAGVPVTPGALVDGENEAALLTAAEKLGFPLLAKAVAGGGGRGLRFIQRPEDLAADLRSASREGLAAFGDGRMLLERWVPQARHVEVQVLGDDRGNVAHLFERECSIQRRHQKLIEETPSPGVTPDLRRRLTEAAVAAARAVGYRNAGTVEFLVEPDGRFYFMEMNTRLQVEHPITEAITGLDLVREQVRLAAGEPLSPALDHLEPRGHAVGCRIYAEDPYLDFTPASGVLLGWLPPSGPGIRVDGGVAQGQQLSTHYDALLAKVIAWGEDREMALSRMRRALRRLVVLGVPSTASFLAGVLGHPEFQRGAYHTRFLEEHPELFERSDPEGLGPLAAALAAWSASRGMAQSRGQTSSGAGLEDGSDVRGPWRRAGAWRL